MENLVCNKIYSRDLDYTIIHHSNMLSDKHRLLLFKSALEKYMTPSSSVVDIGTGMGILAAYAAAITHNTVYAIEYFDMPFHFAQKLINSSSLSNILLLKGNSFDISLLNSPDILITETIGQIGPEENIVEICYDFSKRHPKITRLIPSKLSIYAEIIESNNAKNHLDQYLSGYANASFLDFNFNIIKSDLKNQFSELIMQTSLDDARPLSKPYLLTEYELGVTRSSSFSKIINVARQFKNFYIHLYFEAQVSEEAILSSRYDQCNHWSHSFIPISDNYDMVRIGYSAGSGMINIKWLSN